MRVVFMGTGEIGLPTLRFLLHSGAHELVAIVTQPDKPVGREQRIQAPPIKAALGGRDLPILQPPRIKRDDEAVAAIRAFAPEVIVVMAYGQILPRSVLEIPSVACLNLHASLLPKYRGAAPIQAAILHGDSETGITVMHMDVGMDTGDVLLQKAIPIAPDETGQTLHDRLGDLAPAALAEALTQLRDGTATRHPQSAAEATYAPKLEREDGRIDWSRPAAAIERMIRAYHPWPGTFTIVTEATGTERKLKIFSATIRAGNGMSSGEVRATDTLTIGCAEGALELGEVQLEGKKRMNARDFIRGQTWIAQSRALSFSFPPPPASA